jgi:hypothetical protein
MSGWSRALAAAAFALSAMGVGGCAFFEKPAAVEVLVRQELPPLKQRVTSLEGQMADKADRTALAKLADVTEAHTVVAEAHTNLLSSIAATMESQGNAIAGLEARERWTVQRVVSTELKLGDEAARGQERLRVQMLLMQLKMELASASGVNTSQIDHAELVGFTSGKAQLEALLAQDPKAREQLNAMRAQLVDGRIKILQIAAFEDTAKCRLPDEECATVGLRRGRAVAAYLKAPITLVQASEPTDRWGSPRENRRVIVFYLKKTPARAAAPGAPPPSRRKP